MALDNKNKNEYDQAHHVLGPKSKPGQVKCKMDKSNFEFSFNQNLMVNKQGGEGVYNASLLFYNYKGYDNSECVLPV